MYHIYTYVCLYVCIYISIHNVVYSAKGDVPKSERGVRGQKARVVGGEKCGGEGNWSSGVASSGRDGKRKRVKDQEGTQYDIINCFTMPPFERWFSFVADQLGAPSYSRTGPTEFSLSGFL